MHTKESGIGWIDYSYQPFAPSCPPAPEDNPLRHTRSLPVSGLGTGTTLENHSRNLPTTLILLFQELSSSIDRWNETGEQCSLHLDLIDFFRIQGAITDGTPLFFNPESYESSETSMLRDALFSVLHGAQWELRGSCLLTFYAILVDVLLQRGMNPVYMPEHAVRLTNLYQANVSHALKTVKEQPIQFLSPFDREFIGIVKEKVAGRPNIDLQRKVNSVADGQEEAKAAAVKLKKVLYGWNNTNFHSDHNGVPLIPAGEFPHPFTDSSLIVNDPFTVENGVTILVLSFTNRLTNYTITQGSINLVFVPPQIADRRFPASFLSDQLIRPINTWKCNHEYSTNIGISFPPVIELRELLCGGQPDILYLDAHKDLPTRMILFARTTRLTSMLQTPGAMKPFQTAAQLDEVARNLDGCEHIVLTPGDAAEIANDLVLAFYYSPQLTLSTLHALAARGIILCPNIDLESSLANVAVIDQLISNPKSLLIRTDLKKGKSFDEMLQLLFLKESHRPVAESGLHAFLLAQSEKIDNLTPLTEPGWKNPQLAYLLYRYFYPRLLSFDDPRLLPDEEDLYLG